VTETNTRKYKYKAIRCHRWHRAKIKVCVHGCSDKQTGLYKHVIGHHITNKGKK